MKLKINLQLFSEEATIDFESADMTTDSSSEDLTEQQEDSFLEGLEETNDVEDEEQAEDTDDDYDADQQVEDEDIPEQKETKEEIQLYKVKHLGQEIELTMEQMIENAQKGLDYDRIRTDRDSLKNSKKLKLLDDLAKDSGYDDVDEFIESFNENLENSRLQDRANEIADERGIDTYTALEMAKIERENEKLKRQMQEETASKTKDSDKMNEAVTGFNDLFSKFPDVKSKFTSYDKLPAEFRSKIAEGISPVAAWNSYLLEVKEQELQKKEAEIQTLRNNHTNKKRSPGSVRSAGQAKETDDFLKGLFG